MKKILSKLILIVVLFNMAPLTAFASSSRANDNEIIYFDDGSYIVIELAQENAPVRTTAQKSKSYTYYNSNNEASWKAVLTGTFTYSGTTASCTFSNCDVTIYDDDWYVIQHCVNKWRKRDCRTNYGKEIPWYHNHKENHRTDPDLLPYRKL